MQDLLKDELNRVNASQVYSEYETQIMEEIYAWAMLQDQVWTSSKEVVEAFWKEKLK